MVKLHTYNCKTVISGQLKVRRNASPRACLFFFSQHKPQEMILRHQCIKTIFESCEAPAIICIFLNDYYRACEIKQLNLAIIEKGLSGPYDKHEQQEFSNSYTAKLNLAGYLGQLKVCEIAGAPAGGGIAT